MTGIPSSSSEGVDKVKTENNRITNSNTAKKINIMAMNFLDKKLTTFENEKVGFAKKIFDIFSRRGG